MSNDTIRKLQEQAAVEAQREAEQQEYRKAVQRAELEDANVRYCGERGQDISNGEWAE